MQIDHLPKESGIYKITCTANGKFYIGSSVNIYSRVRGHKRNLRKTSHCNAKLQSAYNKYGDEMSTVSVLLTCKKSDLLLFEQLCLEVLQPKLNICAIAWNTLGFRHSLESRNKIADAHKGNQYAKGNSPPNKGKKASYETRRKLSEAHMGLPSTRKGVPHTDAAKLKMSLARKGKPSGRKGFTHSEETRKKLSSSHTGVKLSEETKMRMSLARKGQKAWNKGLTHSAESRAKISQSNMGRVITPETIAKRNATRATNKQKRLLAEANKRLESEVD